MIEDDKEICELLTEEITRSFKRVNLLCANDPIAALSLFGQNKNVINYILCDYYLPVQNGVDLIEIVKRERPSILVTLFTADTEIEKKSVPFVDAVIYKQNGVSQVTEHIRKTMMNIDQL